MMPTSERTLETLLIEAGFKQDDRLAPGLIGPSEVNSDPDIHIRYGPLLTATQGGTPFGDFVYEVPSDIEGVAGTPCICFKVLDQATPAAINSVRVQVWNHGRVPTLWIITPDSVRIYDSFARPQAEDQSDSSNHLLEELTQIGSRLQGIDDFHKSKFDTGAFWQSGKGRDIQPDQRVDSALLRDLLDTKGALEFEGLDSDVAQALLGRAIFVKYLEDRRILRPFHFQPHRGSQDFSEVLKDITNAYNFFDWLRETFNGDLFPVTQEEKETVLDIHFDILGLFLAGYDMNSYPTPQARLWPYSFETIPIELISSIYEMFAHASDQEAAETTSIHYTRFNLVELVLGLAMRGIPHTAKVLDPACGSGVFLVEAFRRLARLKEKHHGRALTRKELHQLVVSQIFGMDIDRQAVYVAAFSLYLALLELDPDPQPPDALRLPRLLESEESNDGGRNLYVQDFFNPESEFNQSPPFSDRGFDLIVGNPPWTALTANLPSDSDIAPPRQWGVEYCQRHDVPDNKPDQAFAWRAREFCGPGTKVALVIGSRLFFQRSEKAERWRRKFLESNQVINVVNLSDLRNENLLFGKGSSTSQPASVITFSPRPPDENTIVLHVAPKWYPGIRQRDELVVNSVDIQGIPQGLFQRYEFLWKTAFRGTPRDFRFLQRLHSFPTLEDVLRRANVRKGLDRSYGLTFGKNPTKDASHLNGLPYLSAGTTSHSTGTEFRFAIDVDDLSPFTRPHIAEKSNRRALPLPVLILHRGLRDQRTCAALAESLRGQDQIVFQGYYGISLARAPEELSYRLNAILNSELATYLMFFHSSILGWERPVIEIRDWLQLPLPPSILEGDLDGVWAEALNQERWLRTHWKRDLDTQGDHEIHRVQRELDDHISRLYELSDQEKVLMADTLSYTITPFLGRNVRRVTTILEEPTPQQLHDYAVRLCHQINPILRQGGMQLDATVVVGRHLGLNACRFAWRRGDGGTYVSELNAESISAILAQMSIDLRATVADRLYVQQDLRVYDDQAFWIIKPSQARLWSETAALNDADAVLREHMDRPSNE